MQYALQLPGTVKPRDAVSVAQAAEEAGFTQVTLQDNILLPSPWPLLGAMARSTRSIRLGPAVCNPILMHPLEMARQAARLQELAPGRVVLGVGRGSILSLVGKPPQANLAQLREALLLLRACFEGKDSAFPGKIFVLRQAPPRRFYLEGSNVALILGGHGPKAAQLAGQLADGLMVAGLWNVQYARGLRHSLDDAAEKSGRKMRPLLIAAPWTVLEEDTRKAEAMARTTLARSLPFIRSMALAVGIDEGTLERVGAAFRSGDIETAAAAVPSQAIDSMIAWSNLAQRVRELGAAGVDMVSFAGPLSDDLPQALRRLTDMLRSA